MININSQEYKANYNWNLLPTEILTLIIKKLDSRAFQKCRLISKRWRDIVDSIKDNETWERFIKEDFSYKYQVIMSKSALPCHKLYRNIYLWKRVLFANETVTRYKFINIKKIHVYKDTLIMISDNNIKYYNVNDLSLIKAVDRSCIDHEETDHIIMELTKDNTIYLYGKVNKNSSYENQMQINDLHNNTILYKIVDNRCYFINKSNILWLCEWKNNQWTQTFLAKYYGVDEIKHMNVWQMDVYIVTRHTMFYKTNIAEKHFVNIRSQIIGHVNFNYGPFFIDQCSIIYSSTDPLKTSNAVVKEVYLRIPCRRLANVLEHGDIIILAFDFTVAIYSFSFNRFKSLFDKSATLTPVRHITFSLPTIVKAVDVHETINGHVIFLLTEFEVLKVCLSYNF